MIRIALVDDELEQLEREVAAGLRELRGML